MKPIHKPAKLIHPPSSTAMKTTVFFFLLLLLLTALSATSNAKSKLPKSDENLLEIPSNSEYLEAEHYVFGSTGRGLDHIQPNLMDGGLPLVGVISPFGGDIILQFGLQEVGHVRARKSTVRGFPRPLLNSSAAAFANHVINNAFGRQMLYPAYAANDISYLIASYVIPYGGLAGYVPIAKKGVVRRRPPPRGPISSGGPGQTN